MYINYRYGASWVVLVVLSSGIARIAGEAWFWCELACWPSCGEHTHSREALPVSVRLPTGSWGQRSPCGQETHAGAAGVGVRVQRSCVLARIRFAGRPCLGP